jgi:hypothetical protein
MLQQFTQHVGPHAVSAFDEFAGFLQRLAHADFAQQLQQSALRRRNLRRPAAFLEQADLQQGFRLLVEQPLSVVFSGKALCEPFWQMPRGPAIKMQSGLLRHVLAQAIPVKRRLAAYVQPLELALQQ